MENTHPTFFQQYKYHLLGGGLVLATVIGIVIWQVRKKKKPKVWQETAEVKGNAWEDPTALAAMLGGKKS